MCAGSHNRSTSFVFRVDNLLVGTLFPLIRGVSMPVIVQRRCRLLRQRSISMNYSKGTLHVIGSADALDKQQENIIERTMRETDRYASCSLL
jgi:hypothetical protein